MPKTEVNSDSASNNRFNPYITKGISKTLLTPCRRVGLSRKRKTPNSDKILDNESTNPITSLEVSTLSDNKVSGEAFGSNKSVKTLLTPCRHVGLSRKRKTPNTGKSLDNESKSPITPKNNSNDDSTQKVNSNPNLIKANRNKSSVSKCLIVSDNDSTSLQVATLNDDSVINAVEVASNKSIKHVKDNRKDKKNLSHLIEQNSEKTSCGDKMKNSTVEENSEALRKRKPKSCDEKRDIKKDLVSEKTITAVQKQKFKNLKDDNHVLKEINSEKSCTRIDSILTDTPKLDNISKEKTVIKSTKSSENSTLAYEKQFFDPIEVDHDYIKPEKKSKLKRSLSMKKSNEELGIKKAEKAPQAATIVTKECSIIIPDEIKKLEQQVQEKRKLVEDLKQAEIYKKIHEVDKLKDLTSTWKNGCISALTDLLPQLQGHVDIDMKRLLNNLKVPEQLITLSETGNLI